MKFLRACLVIIVIGFMMVSSEASHQGFSFGNIPVSLEASVNTEKSYELEGYNMNLEDQPWHLERLVPGGPDPIRSPGTLPSLGSKRLVPGGPDPIKSPGTLPSLGSKRLVPSGFDTRKSPGTPPLLSSKKLVHSSHNPEISTEIPSLMNSKRLVPSGANHQGSPKTPPWFML
ncbi:hypothetical protein M5689_024906 [Euphorbia peplus]|nr:hypothetical protein M5689_024906 [Euphorbia peplus]